METKPSPEMVSQARSYLTQIALELDASATGAKEAARLVDEPQAALPHVHMMYARLHEANYLLERFKRTIDDAIAKKDG